MFDNFVRIKPYLTLYDHIVQYVTILYHFVQDMTILYRIWPCCTVWAYRNTTFYINCKNPIVPYNGIKFRWFASETIVIHMDVHLVAYWLCGFRPAVHQTDTLSLTNFTHSFRVYRNSVYAILSLSLKVCHFPSVIPLYKYPLRTVNVRTLFGIVVEWNWSMCDCSALLSFKWVHSTLTGHNYPPPPSDILGKTKSRPRWRSS